MVSNFKADLEYGQLQEKFVSELGKDVSIEVKADRRAFSTGNIFIELECNGKLSGINSTHASYWIHLLPKDAIVIAGFIFKVEKLKIIIPKLIEDGIAIKKDWSGDSGRVKGIIVSLTNIGELIKRMGTC